TDSGRWPAGTTGTVVEADDERVLVEISDDRGHGLDFVALPHHAFAATTPGTADRLASCAASVVGTQIPTRRRRDEVRKPRRFREYLGRTRRWRWPEGCRRLGVIGLGWQL